MLPVNKIYIDSRQRTSDTQSSSNFKIELDRGYRLPNATVFFITDVCIPHSWMTVETGSNDNIYFMITENGGLTFTYYIATMIPGVYDGPGFKTALNVRFMPLMHELLCRTLQAIAFCLYPYRAQDMLYRY